MSFRFASSPVHDHAVQLNFEQLGRCLPGHHYSAAFTALAAGASAQTTIATDALGVNFMVLGSVNYTGAIAGQDQVTWAWRQTAFNAIEVSIHNAGGAAVTGSLFVAILGFTS